MSWDIWITCFDKGEVGRFPREVLERAFEEVTADFDKTMGTPTVTTDADVIMEMIEKA